MILLLFWPSFVAIYFVYFISAEFGPYTLQYTPSGRYMAVGGRKGHLGILDLMSMNLIKEFQVLSLYFCIT